MRRDLDLLRDLLLEIESRGPGKHRAKSFVHDERDPNAVAWHLALLADAGFISAVADSAARTWEPITRPRIDTILIYRLTHQGCDYLDSVREPARWQGVKSKLADQVSSAPLDIVKAVAVAAIKESLGI